MKDSEILRRRGCRFSGRIDLQNICHVLSFGDILSPSRHRLRHIFHKPVKVFSPVPAIVAVFDMFLKGKVDGKGRHYRDRSWVRTFISNIGRSILHRYHDIVSSEFILGVGTHHCLTSCSHEQTTTTDRIIGPHFLKVTTAQLRRLSIPPRSD